MEKVTTTTKKAVHVPCRCGCGVSVRLTGARREKYEETGVASYSSFKCRDRGKNTTTECAREGCKKIVQVSKKYLEQRVKGVFCSPECKVAEGCKPKTGENVPCAQCQEPTWVTPSTKKEQNFCTTACHNAWQARNRIAKTCEVCQTEFEVPLSQESYQYCSRKCGGRAKSAASTGWTTSSGYWRIPDPDAPGQSVDEHVYKARIALSRPLRKGEEVHHRNGNRVDNRTDGPFAMNHRGHLVSGNLEIWSTRQPKGQEIGPKLDWAMEMQEEYEPYLTDEYLERMAAILERRNRMRRL